MWCCGIIYCGIITFALELHVNVLFHVRSTWYGNVLHLLFLSNAVHAVHVYKHLQCIQRLEMLLSLSPITLIPLVCRLYAGTCGLCGRSEGKIIYNREFPAG